MRKYRKEGTAYDSFGRFFLAYSLSIRWRMKGNDRCNCFIIFCLLCVLTEKWYSLAVFGEGALFSKALLHLSMVLELNGTSHQTNWSTPTIWEKRKRSHNPNPPPIGIGVDWKRWRGFLYLIVYWMKIIIQNGQNNETRNFQRHRWIWRKIPSL